MTTILNDVRPTDAGRIDTLAIEPAEPRRSETRPSDPRYAIYFAPPAKSPLWRFGSSVIGYDAETGREAPLPALSRFTPERWRDLTAEPRRYGFHGTLKAPFRLAPGKDEADLRAVCARFAADRASFACAGVMLASIGRFFALKTVSTCSALNRLAAGAVAAFDDFRAPMTEAERERRLRAPLTERQKDYLGRWGYPYVLDDFRFHMTLTGPLDDADRAAAEEELAQLFAQSGADGPLIVGGIALYRQDGRADGGERFRLIERYAFGS
ncbi:DUF1045 domain-containing protein [Ancylobacter sp. Lp-2]|uniref:DUF1045 domain-containing protein n=1 Tax=Ancylobacter sp. Lp-2 TaxID=2881339 RepID=UPI001E5965E2|nr:DUF1045 domain-containing protein [Ancylobacter sp. Lp-2]MCB4767434.1 DUF1045 domain-containing protein [Ancylobacter sp. Lp-2]